MKATETKLIDFMKKSPQFVVPIYQRNYSWKEEECEQLWDDIVRVGSDENISSHFIGSIVYVEDGIYSVTDSASMLVIDGQQRLTTITLLLIALMENIGDSEIIDGCSARKIKGCYLVNQYESGDKYYKLILSQTDKDTLLNLLGAPEPQEKSLRIQENFNFFVEQLKRREQAENIWKGLVKLVLVDISLNRDQDNPQLIFESMNSTGLALTQADLIRNFFLMGLAPDKQKDLYLRFWRPMECSFGQDAYTLYFDKFMRNYLTVKTGEIPKVDEVYDRFKKYIRQPDVCSQDIVGLIADVRVFADYYCRIVLGAEVNNELKDALNDLKELKIDVVYPLLLEIYDDYANKNISLTDFIEIIRLLESYICRRAACGIPTNSLDKTFIILRKTIIKEHYAESIKAQLLMLQSYRRFPDNSEFKEALETRDLYPLRLCNYWLWRIENYGRKEKINIKEYTIEHILPQNPNLSEAWREDLGNNWIEIQKKWLHTLGNLTLTAYNSEYSDRPFAEKRDMEGGYKVSPLHLNSGLGQVEVWNGEAIIARAEKLSEKAVKIWPMPTLPQDVLTQYSQKTRSVAYSITDHPYLLTGITQKLFEAFRREVLSLNPCVTEEFFKLYVAYKAETNFVDVIPQKKRLSLSVNMPYEDVYDPQKKCENMTNIGSWGNGDVRLIFSNLDELPYVMCIVRQAFERQLDAE